MKVLPYLNQDMWVLAGYAAPGADIYVEKQFESGKFVELPNKNRKPRGGIAQLGELFERCRENNPLFTVYQSVVSRKMEARMDKMKRARFFLSLLAPFSSWARNRVNKIENYKAAYQKIAQPVNLESALARFYRREGKKFDARPTNDKLKVFREFWKEASATNQDPYPLFQEKVKNFYKGKHGQVGIKVFPNSKGHLYSKIIRGHTTS